MTSYEICDIATGTSSVIGLNMINTTADRNGYPRDIKYAVTGFDNQKDLNKFLCEYPMFGICKLMKRDGWDMPYRDTGYYKDILENPETGEKMMRYKYDSATYEVAAYCSEEEDFTTVGEETEGGTSYILFTTSCTRYNENADYCDPDCNMDATICVRVNLADHEEVRRYIMERAPLKNEEDRKAIQEATDCLTWTDEYGTRNFLVLWD